MSFQIKEIILAGHTSLRRVPFELGKMNVITGFSKKGKTALTDIVEYCLGRPFQVPVGPIRDRVRWYGVLLSFGNDEVLIFREKPVGSQKNNSNCYIDVAGSVEIPKATEIQGNESLDGVISFLADKVGISENLVVPKEKNESPGEAKLKHSIIYNFQTQEEIDSRKHLFHRQDENRVADYIKLMFPYFVGSIDEDDFSNRLEFRRLNSLHRRLVAELNEIEAIQVEGVSQGEKMITSAKTLGMISNSYEPEDLNDIVENLNNVLTYRDDDIYNSPNTTLSNFIDKREELFEEIDDLELNLKTSLRVRKEKRLFDKEGSIQLNRLNSIGLFDSIESEGSKLDFIKSIEGEIVTAISNLERQLSNVTLSTPKLDSYIDDLKKNLGEKRLELKKLNQNIRVIEEEDKKLKEQKDKSLSQELLKGKVTLYLDSIKNKDNTSKLKEQIKKIKEELDVLEKKIDPELIVENTEAIIESLADDMTSWAEKLHMEHKGRYKLDYSKMTVTSITEKGPVLMNDMGSGANWIGCHLIFHLALHKWLVSKGRPVPRFLFIDQPSQAYFPADKKDIKDLPLEELAEGDRESVKRMYKLVYDIVKDEFDGKLQVIFLDHVDMELDWFEECVVERWRGKEALIPDGF